MDLSIAIHLLSVSIDVIGLVIYSGMVPNDDVYVCVQWYIDIKLIIYIPHMIFIFYHIILYHITFYNTQLYRRLCSHRWHGADRHWDICGNIGNFVYFEYFGYVVVNFTCIYLLYVSFMVVLRYFIYVCILCDCVRWVRNDLNKAINQLM